MSRGGDRRSIRTAIDEDLHLATQLFGAMLADSSRAGCQFGSEYEALFRRWRRLISVLDDYPASGLPGNGPYSLAQMQQYLDLVQIAPPVHYPRPRPLTDDDLGEIERRRARATAARNRHWLENYDALGANEPAANAAWHALTLAREDWVSGDVWRAANPGRKLRWSRRVAVRRYISEVERFAARWRLRADWATALIVYSHVLRLHLPSDAPSDATFAVFVTSAFERAHHTIVAGIPGRSPHDVARDCVLAHVRLTATLHPDAPQPVRVVWRPSREQFAALEHGADAACVIVEWDGRAQYRSRHESERSVDIAEHVIEEIEGRIGRRLTVREARAVKREIDPQIQAARAAFLTSGFGVDGVADLDLHARWVARRLLRPHTSYAQVSRLAPRRDRHGMVEVPEPATVRNACLAFARRAGLTLP